MNWEAIVWLGLMIGFMAVEGATVAIVSVWFAVGALVSLLASLLTAPVWLQIVLFLLVSGLCLALLRPFAKKHFNVGRTRTNVESVAGTSGIVTEDIDNVRASGHVKLGTVVWSARSTSGQPISRGTLVKADRVEGVKVYVTVVNQTT